MCILLLRVYSFIIYTYIYLYILIYTYIYLYILIYTYIYLYILIYTYIYLYILIYTYIYLYILIYTYIYLYILIYTYIYLYILISQTFTTFQPASTYTIFLHQTYTVPIIIVPINLDFSRTHTSRLSYIPDLLPRSFPSISF